MTRLPRQERRTRVVQAAMGVFAKTGFRGTRTRDLAGAAGISEALLFKLFPTKRALQQALIEERIRQVGEFVPGPEADPEPRELLVSLASRFFAMCGADPSFMRLLLFSGLEREPLAPIFFRTRVSRNIGRLAAHFRRWTRRGKIRRGLDARLAAWSFMAIIVQLTMWRHIFGVKRMEDRPGDLAGQIADLFLKGIRP